MMAFFAYPISQLFRSGRCPADMRRTLGSTSGRWACWLPSDRSSPR